MAQVLWCSSMVVTNVDLHISDQGLCPFSGSVYGMLSPCCLEYSGFASQTKNMLKWIGVNKLSIVINGVLALQWVDTSVQNTGRSNTPD